MLRADSRMNKKKNCSKVTKHNSLLQFCMFHLLMIRDVVSSVQCTAFLLSVVLRQWRGIVGVTTQRSNFCCFFKKNMETFRCFKNAFIFPKPASPVNAKKYSVQSNKRIEMHCTESIFQDGPVQR